MRLDDYRITGRVLETADYIVYRLLSRSDGAVCLAETPRHVHPASGTAYRHAARALGELDGGGAMKLRELRFAGDQPWLIHPDGGEMPLRHWLAGADAGGTEAAWMRKLRWAIAAADSLERVHAAGLVHNALQLERVWVEPRTLQVRYAGWHSSLMPERDAGERDAGTGPLLLSKAQLLYAAPEQTGRIAQAPSRASDIYSLGALLYEALCGRPPFQRQDEAALIYAHVAERYTPLERHASSVGAALSAIVDRCLEKEPARRWTSAAALRDALRRCQEEARARPVRREVGAPSRSERAAIDALRGNIAPHGDDPAAGDAAATERAEAEAACRSDAEPVLPESAGASEGSSAAAIAAVQAYMREALIAGREDEAYARFESSLAAAGSLRERAELFLALVALESERNRPERAVRTAARCLAELGVRWPASSLPRLAARCLRLAWRVRGGRIGRFERLNDCGDERLTLAMRVLAAALNDASLTSRRTWLDGVVLLLDHTLRSGRMPASIGAFAGLAAFHTFLTHRMGRARLWDRLGRELDRAEDRELTIQIAIVRVMTYESWRHAEPELLDRLVRFAERSVEAADRSRQADRLGLLVSVLMLNCGRPLDEIYALYDRSSTGLAAESVDYLLIRYAAAFGRLLDRLRGQRTADERYALAERRLRHGNAGLTAEQRDFLERSALHFGVIADYWEGNCEDGLSALRKLGVLDKKSILQELDTGIYGLYYVLVLAELAPVVMQTERRAYHAAIRGLVKRLARFAARSPYEYRHKHALAAAEYARVVGDEALAERRYEEACAAAGADGHLHNLIIAAENAGKFARERGKPHLARGYLIQAYETALLWGARAKAAQLADTYGHLFYINLMTLSGQMDYRAVTGAVQAIAEEMRTERLLPRLMSTLLRNAGAERGVLAVAEGDGLRIAAIASGDAVDLVSEPMSGSDALCAEIADIAARSHEPVVLPDASREGVFTGIPYIKSRAVRSLLVLPLLKNARLVGIVYLENNLSAGVFTQERLDVLKLLAAQCAVSLENASLYGNVERMKETLEERVEARTRSLELSMKETAAAWAEASIQADRTRIAADVHDIVGHTITSTLLQLEATKRHMSKDEAGAARRLEGVQTLLRQGLNDIRSTIHMLKEADAASPEEALTKLIAATEAGSGVVIEADIGFLPELSGQYRHMLYHALQEGMTNGIRHGGADRFRLRIRYEDELLRFELFNNGAWAGEMAFGFGLSAMQERVERLEGNLTISAEQDGRGVLLAISLPYAARVDIRREALGHEAYGSNAGQV